MGAAPVRTRTFSGVQPLGGLHLGNYIAAVKQWLELQAATDAFFMIADMEALAIVDDPRELHRSTVEAAAILLAAGVDPAQATLFRQSDIPEHTELAWILNAITFKAELAELAIVEFLRLRAERSGSQQTMAGFGFPVLVAADVLLYDVDVVPAGEEERESVDLARTLASRFNERFGETFMIPEIAMPKRGAVIRDLARPSAPMTKSASSGTIFVLDPPDVIRQKVTGAMIGTEADSEEHVLGLDNALTILGALSGATETETSALSVADVRSMLVDQLIATLLPLQARYRELISARDLVAEVLADSAQRAGVVARATLARARTNVGLCN